MKFLYISAFKFQSSLLATRFHAFKIPSVDKQSEKELKDKKIRSFWNWDSVISVPNLREIL